MAIEQRAFGQLTEVAREDGFGAGRFSRTRTWVSRATNLETDNTVGNALLRTWTAAM